MRKLLYGYSQALGLLKLALYKLFFGGDLALDGMPHISHKATIRVRKGGKAALGDRSRLSEGDYLWVTEGAEFRLGDNSGLGVDCVVSCRKKVIIGNNVMVGPFVTIYDNDHIYATDGPMMESGYVTSPVTIGDNVWIGSHVRILKGVTIGEGSVIAAGSTVNKDVSPDCVFHNRKEDISKPKRKE